jgi:hypothetical protein
MATATLAQLIASLDNVHQRAILQRLDARSESERLYLLSYDANVSSDARKAHVQGVFRILGSMNARGQRSEYSVQLFRQGRPASFWCSCPDHKFKSTKTGTLCKHISFIVVRFARMLAADVFQTRCLSAEQAAVLGDLLSRPLRDVATDGLVAPDFAVPAGRVFEADDVCPVCYEELGAPPPPIPTAACPNCHQCVHSGCMAVWLERHDTCVMCRSDVWRSFRM